MSTPNSVRSFQVALGEPGKQKLYPHVVGKEEWRKKMIEMFPGEASAINKYMELLDVKCFELFCASEPIRVVDEVERSAEIAVLNARNFLQNS